MMPKAANTPATDADSDPHRRQRGGAGRVIRQVAKASDGLANDAKGCAITIRAVLPKIGNMRHDEIGPRSFERLHAQAKLLELSGPEIFNQRVAAGNKAKHDGSGLRMLEVERHRTLVASVQRPPERLPVDLLAPLPHRIAARRLDLDHLGAEVGKQARAERSRHEVPDLEDAQAG
jgi:hypothetical protein